MADSTDNSPRLALGAEPASAVIVRRGWVILFIVFLMTRAAFFVAIRPWAPERRDTHFVVSDAGEYYWTARHLLDGSTYGASPLPAHPPDAARTPGYPLFLAWAMAVFGDSISAIVLLQMLLQAVTLVLLYVGSGRLFSDRTAFWVTLYCVVDPVYLVMSGWLYSETLYQLFNVLFAYCLLAGVRGGFSYRSACVVGICFALGLLTRPFALYFLPVVLVAIAWSDSSVARGALKSAVAAACVALLLFPWVYRNRALFGSWSMSSVEGTSLQQYYIAPFLAAQQQRPLDEVRAELAKATPHFDNPFDRVAYIKAQTIDIVTQHPLQYLVFHFRSVWPVMAGANTEALAAMVSDDGAQQSVGRAGAADVVGGSDGGWMRAAVVACNLILLGILYALYLLGLWHLWRSRQRLLLLVVIAGVLYLPAITGPMSSSRYRLSIVPFLLYGAGVTIFSREVRRNSSDRANLA